MPIPPNKTAKTTKRASTQGGGFTTLPWTADNLEGMYGVSVRTMNSKLGFRPCFFSTGGESIGVFSIPSIGQTGYIPPVMTMPDIQQQIYLADRWKAAAVPPMGMSAFLSGTDPGAVIADGSLYDRRSPEWTQLGMFFSPIPLVGNYFMLFFGATEDPTPGNNFTHGLTPFGWSTRDVPPIKAGSIDGVTPTIRRSRAHSAGRRAYRMGVGLPLYLMASLRAYATEADSVGVYSPNDHTRTVLADTFWEQAAKAGAVKESLNKDYFYLDAPTAAANPLVVGVPAGALLIQPKARLLERMLHMARPEVKRARAEMLARSFHVMNQRACGFVQAMIQSFGNAEDLALYNSRPEVQAALSGNRLAGIRRSRLSTLPPVSAQTNRLLSGLRFE